MNVLEQRQAEAVVSIAKTLRTPDWEQRQILHVDTLKRYVDCWMLLRHWRRTHQEGL